VPIPARALRSTLTGKFGFSGDGTGRGPHEKFRLEVDGVYVAHTMVSRGATDIDDSLVAAIARQLGVSRKQVYEMVGCQIDKPSYLNLLR
jgi:hypothetical protein